MGSERNTNILGYMDSDCRGFHSNSLARRRLGTRSKSEDVSYNRNQPQAKVPLGCKNLDCLNPSFRYLSTEAKENFDPPTHPSVVEMGKQEASGSESECCS